MTSPILRCRYRLPWGDHHQCDKRGWVLGWCVAHALDRVRFEHDGRWSHWSLDLGNMNRPYLMVDDERPIRWVALSWGNTNSDPVWSLIIGRKGQR